MFGFSFIEFITVLIVALIFIKPEDLPEIARFIARIFYRLKKLSIELRNSLLDLEKESNISSLRHEIAKGIAEEKSIIEEDTTVIVDLYGNEHKVSNLNKMRSDLSSEALKDEVNKLNDKNYSAKVDKKN